MDNVILLADKNSPSWNFAKKVQGYIQKEKEVEVPLEEVCIDFFRNKEKNMYIPENMRKKDVYFIHDSSKNPQEWWVELLLLKDLLLSASAESVTYVLPNMLYARQDRKPKPHVPISARAFARSISPGIKRIITMDLHAQQIQGFYPENVPLDSLDSFPEVVRYLQENKKDISNLEELVIVSPDVGGAKRARALAKRLKSIYPIALIDKTRSQPGKVDEMRLIGEVKDKNILVTDDIIDSGGTLCDAYKLLKTEGALKIWNYATHGLFTKGTKEICECYDRVMVSNTHFIEKDDIEIIDVAPLIGEAIYRAQKGLSISKLFE